jgi:hypothetical protein
MAEDNSKAEPTEISASEILDKILKGEPVKCDNKRIVGNLDLSTLNLPTEHADRTEYQIKTLELPKECKIVSSSIRITNSEFNGKVDFSNCIFKTDVYFRKTTFNGDADFKGATFSDSSYFRLATFNGDADFDGATFSGYADFRKGYIYFRKAKFNRNAGFNGATFSGYANFRKVTFNGNADFKEAKFNSNADFNSATFNKDALFEGAKFEKELDLTFTEYKRLFIRWESISKTRHKWKLLENWNKSCNIIYDDTTYLLLIENLKNLGFFEDADNCYYNYRIERRRQWQKKPKESPNKIYQFIDLVLWLFYGYGVRPLRPLAGLVFLILAFGLLYPYLGVAGNSTWAAFNTSLIVSLSGTKLIEDPTHPATFMHYWIFSIEKLLASLFFAMFLVSLGKTIIR